MAADTYSDPSQDQNWQDQVRQQVMAQVSADPSADRSSATASTPSPDFADPTPTAQPVARTYASENQGDSTNGGGAVDAGTPAAAGAPNVPAPGNDANQIQGWYSQFLGRNASDADIQSHLQNPGGLGAVMNLIANSPEAQAYAKAHGFGQPNPTPSGTNGGGGSAGGGGGVSSGAAGGPVAAPQMTAWQDAIRAIIQSRLAAAQQPIDPNSPEIATSVNAAKDQLSRQSDVERNALAERLYAQRGGGLNTDAINQGVQQSNERQGTALSGLRATLIMNEYNQKRQELGQLLNLATQSGDAEAARNIQVELANLQAAVAREGLGVNLAEFGAQLNQNATLAGLN